MLRKLVIITIRHYNPQPRQPSLYNPKKKKTIVRKMTLETRLKIQEKKGLDSNEKLSMHRAWSDQHSTSRRIIRRRWRPSYYWRRWRWEQKRRWRRLLVSASVWWWWLVSASVWWWWLVSASVWRWWRWLISTSVWWWWGGPRIRWAGRVEAHWPRWGRPRGHSRRSREG
ncbi:hypothetical protein OIU79_001101 [Salix purpurea]|uniref:Uncharacterized protein n=1 Tax=Salix purpurea TaxID=77065 RepID=A0A9Q0V2U7_SALPP|nr:hypothetical protein OIU79_001101 [Salix purpurea]